MSSEEKRSVLTRRQPLPKLMACASKASVEFAKYKLLSSMEMFNAVEVRRSKLPLHQCLILELSENGYIDSSEFLTDLIEDNLDFMKRDEIGIIVDLRGNDLYLFKINNLLKAAEGARQKGKFQYEVSCFLRLALYFSQEGKGILWLAEKFYLVAIAAAEKIAVDGGRLYCCCRYYYGKFLLDKFDTVYLEESETLLSDARYLCIGKTWLLKDKEEGEEEVEGEDKTTVFAAVATQIHRALLAMAKILRDRDCTKAASLCRRAEKRADDAENLPLKAEAITELGICQLMMNDLNNALRSFERALEIATASNYIEGMCDGNMHVASALQRLGDYEGANKALSTMGTLSIKYQLRKKLGTALHLLGELHLRRARPEMATPHLREAFQCFMGQGYQEDFMFQHISRILNTAYEDVKVKKTDKEKEGEGETKLHEEMETLHQLVDEPVYIQEAQRSRVMMAVSSGQEKMSSYFTHICNAKECIVDRLKILEWKLRGVGWWVQRMHHQFTPCPCPRHERTPLDVVKMKEAAKIMNTTKSNLKAMRQINDEEYVDFKALMDEEEDEEEKEEQSNEEESSEASNTLTREEQIVEATTPVSKVKISITTEEISEVHISPPSPNQINSETATASASRNLIT